MLHGGIVALLHDVGTRFASKGSRPASLPVRRNRGLLWTQLATAFWLLATTFLATVSAWLAVTVVSLWDSGTTHNDTMYRIEQAGVRFNVCLVIVALGVSLGVGRLRPSLWRRMLLTFAISPFPLLCFTSGNTRAGLVVVALFGPCCWLGREVAHSFLHERDRLDAWVIGAPLGLVMVAAAGFTLGTIELLRAPVLWVVLLLLFGSLAWRSSSRLRADLVALRNWTRTAVTPEWWQLLLGGIALAYLWLNLLGALTPETYSDAVRIRLPVAVEFARLGQLTVTDPNISSVAHDTAVGETIYAVGLALGPLATAKLFNYLIGVCCALVAFALGRRLGGWRAGLLGAIALYTMPETFWLSQTAYLDLFVTLLALGAALILVRWIGPDWRAALIAGGCIGIAVMIKIQFGYVAVGLAVVLGFLALRRGGPLFAIRLVGILFGSAVLVAAAPLWPSFRLTGQLAGFALATASLSRTSGESPTIMFDLATFGYGRSPSYFLRSLLDLTINSHRFEWIPTHWGPTVGVIGYLLLGCLPLLLAYRPRMRVLAVAIGCLVAFLLWFYTAQYLRYGLPIFALLCPVAATAFVFVYRRLRVAPFRVLALACVIVLLGAGVVVQLRVPNTGRQFAFGQEGTTAYLGRDQICCIGYPALALLNAQPAVGRVLSVPDPARLYTGLSLESPMTAGVSSPFSVLQTEADVLKAIDTGGYSHIIINRWALPTSWAQMLLVQEEFLRRNTTLVGGGNNAYIYRILPPAERGHDQPWVSGPELLRAFVAVTPDSACGWTRLSGQPRCETRPSGVTAYLLPTDQLAETVPVTPQTTYLLSQVSQGMGANGRVVLRIDWQDSAGATIASLREEVPTSTLGEHRFSMLAAAPPTAVSASIVVQTADGTARVRDVSLRAVVRDGVSDLPVALP